MAELRLDDRGDAIVLTLERPVLARGLLRALAGALDELAAAPTVRPVVLASVHPTIYLAGADLGEIAALDAASCGPYAALGRSLGRRLASHPAPVVAAVHGSCSGGGFDLVLACDAVVAAPGATFAHPGVLRGLVTGWGGTVALPAAVGRPATRRALLEGSPLSAAELAATGAVAEVATEPLPAALELGRRLHRLHPGRLRLWRLLRGPRFVDRFRATVIEKS